MLSYSSLTISGATLINFFNTRVFNFYTDEVKLNIAYIPLVMTIYAIYNAINDHLFGWLSDKTRTRLGRRFPYILFGFIPLTIAFAAIWFIPQSLVDSKSQILILLYMITTLLIFDTLYTIVVLNWHSLFPEKFKTSKERNYVSALRQMISLIGVILAVVVAPLIFEYDNLYSYRKAILIISGFILLGFALSLYGCRDAKSELEPVKKSKSYKKMLGEVLKNKNLISFLVAFGLANVAYLTLLAMLPYYNKWVLLKSAENESILYGIGIGAAALAFFFWARLSLKIGSKAVFIISSIIFSVALIPLIFSANIIVVYIVMGIVGVPLAGLLLVPEVLLSEVIDDDYQRNKQKREGLFFGFYGFFVRIALIVESALISLILAITGYNPDSLSQTNLAQTGIKILMIGVPAACFVLGIIVMFRFYDLSKKRLGKA